MSKTKSRYPQKMRTSLHSNISVIVISGRTSVQDRINSLELGADDYLVKPFNIDELIARINTVLKRRNNPQFTELNGVHKIAQFEVNLDDLTISKDDQIQNLTLAEVKLLRVLLNSPGRLLSREYILAAIGENETFDRAIDVRISKLRRKLCKGNTATDPFRTVYGGGYIFTP